MRRPAPRSPAPTPRIGHRSSPVNGSVPGSVFGGDWFVVALAAVDGVVDVAAGVDVVAPVVAVDGAEGDVELAVGAAGVDVGADEAPVEGGVEDPEEGVEEPEDGGEPPASGSMYCWSPADDPPPPPEATATAGPTSERRTTASRQLRMCRGCTPRVLQGWSCSVPVTAPRSPSAPGVPNAAPSGRARTTDCREPTPASTSR